MPEGRATLPTTPRVRGQRPPPPAPRGTTDLPWCHARPWGRVPCACHNTKETTHRILPYTIKLICTTSLFWILSAPYFTSPHSPSHMLSALWYLLVTGACLYLWGQVFWHAMRHYGLCRRLVREHGPRRGTYEAVLQMAQLDNPPPTLTPKDVLVDLPPLPSTESHDDFFTPIPSLATATV